MSKTKSHNASHFTGKAKKTKRKTQKSTRKQRKAKRGTSVNKYANPQESGKQNTKWVNPKDKTFRKLPLKGNPGDIIPAGTTALFHSRVYELIDDVIIAPDGVTYGEFKLKRLPSQV